MVYDTDVGVVNVSGVNSLHLGRAEDNDVIVDDQLVSRHHAVIKQEGIINGATVVGNEQRSCGCRGISVEHCQDIAVTDF